MSEERMHPDFTQIAGAPVVDYFQGIYIAKASNGNLLIQTVHALAHNGPHVVLTPEAVARLREASDAPR